MGRLNKRLGHRRADLAVGFGFATLFLLSGCAVLQLEVDVYKGPLANNARVQTEQTAVLAIGARPLLIQLRDRLEAGGSDTSELRRKSWYVDGFIPQPPGQLRNFDFLQNEQAIRVNAILSLYEDQGESSRGGQLVGEAVQAFTAYGRHQNNVNGTGIAGRDTWERQFEASLRHSFDDYTWLANSTRRYSIATSIETLAEAYREFVNARPGSYRNRDVVRRHLDLRDAIASDTKLRGAIDGLAPPLEAPLPPRQGERRDSLIVKSKKELRRAWQAEFNERPSDWKRDRRRNDIPFWYSGDEVRLGANVEFLMLEQPELIRSHARLLFRDPDGPVARRFQETVTSIASSFRRARVELRRIWLAAINYLKLHGGVCEQDVAAASVVAQLSHYRRFPQAIQELARIGKRSDEGVERRFRQAYRRYLLGLSDDKSQVEERAARTSDLVHRSAKAAEWSLDVDANAIVAPTSRDVTELGRKIRILRNQYGAVVAPVPTKAEIAQSAEDLRNFVAALSRNLGFADARLAQGLATIIKNYIQSAYNDGDDVPSTQNAQRQLLAALERFAEKLRVVAGFNTFVSTQSASRGAIRPARTGRRRTQELQDLRSYIDTLEAISTAIDTSVNSLKNRADHENRMRGPRLESEKAALAAAVKALNDNAPGSASKRVQDMAESAGNPDDARDIVDRLIGLLNYELAEALRGGDADEAKIRGLRAAIEVAENHRSGMVFLQSASTFLKNSYPASSLQRNSLATWRNLLEEHGGRQFPLVREPRSEAIQEIDKQYWQNVNTVRLAGSGSTNYTVAQDDTGNWYVKEYASDPREIIKGAKSLALFAAKGAISADALERAAVAMNPEDFRPDEREAIRENQPSEDGSVAAKIIEGQKRRDMQALIDLHEKLRGAVRGLPNALPAKWNDVLDDDANRAGNLVALRAATALAGGSLDVGTIDAKGPAKSFRTALEATKAFGDRVVANLTLLRLNDGIAWRRALGEIVAANNEIMRLEGLTTASRATNHEMLLTAQMTQRTNATATRDGFRATYGDAMGTVIEPHLNAWPSFDQVDTMNLSGGELGKVRKQTADAVNALLKQALDMRIKALSDHESRLAVIGDAVTPRSGEASSTP